MPGLTAESRHRRGGHRERGVPPTERQVRREGPGRAGGRLPAAAVRAAAPQHAPPPPPPAPRRPVEDRWWPRQPLASLHAQGILSDEEFASAKAKAWASYCNLNRSMGEGIDACLVY